MIFVFLTFLLIFELMGFLLYEDILSPICLVCESFIIAVLCGMYSSMAEGWDFSICGETLLILLVGLAAFFIGSFIAKGFPASKRGIPDKNDISFIVIDKKKLYAMLISQLIIFMIYLFYFAKVFAYINLGTLAETLRYQRFYSSYGNGMEVSIPSIVQHLVKLARANSYIALYVLMHNIAVKGVLRKKLPKNTKLLLLIIVLFLPYPILQSARFDVLVVVIVGLVIWYTYYRFYSESIGRKQKNTFKSLRVLLIVFIIALAVFPIVGFLVGRSADAGVLKETTDYFGRAIKAFDVYIGQGVHTTNIVENETFYNLIKFLQQLHIIAGDRQKFFLEFTSISGYSLGNTYTALRRYYSDFGIIGVFILQLISGLFFSYLYRKNRRPQISSIDMGFMFYAAIVFCCFLISYEEYLFSTITSINYLLIFIIMHIVKKYVMSGNYRIRKR